MESRNIWSFPETRKIVSMCNYICDKKSSYEYNNKVSSYQSDLAKPLAIDLFCGAGGMSEGILQAGFHIIFSSDINISVKQTYVNRHEQLGLIQGKNTHFELADVRELLSENIMNAIKNLQMLKGKAIPPIDAIFGGPPCQGFSRAGKRNQDDPRNFLFREYLRIVNEIRPKYVVMENVEGFLDTKLPGYTGVKGTTYDHDMSLPELLLKEFQQIGYSTLTPQVLDASDFGVPQRRKRVIFIAYVDGQAVPQYPKPTTKLENQKTSVSEAISDLIVNPSLRFQIHKVSSNYQSDSKIGRTPTTTKSLISNYSTKLNHELSKHNNYIIERFSLFREGESTSILVKRLLIEGLALSMYPSLLNECSMKLAEFYTTEEIIKMFLEKNITDRMIETLLTKKNSRIRLSSNTLAPTMVTLPDDFISPFENRILTVREMARIQSFDDSFEFLGKKTTGGDRRRVEVPQYTQVGNAVPPLLSKAIAQMIKDTVEVNRINSGIVKSS